MRKIGLILSLFFIVLSQSISAEALYDTVVFCCSEPMPSVKSMFDQDLGRFVSVRNMGNVVSLAGPIPDRIEIGSVEYAVEYGASRIIVLGHKGCNIIRSVIENPRGRGNQPAIYQVLSRSITSARSETSDPEKILQKSIENNVLNSVFELRENRFILYDHVRSGAIKVEGAIYDPETGKAEFLNIK